MIENKTLLIEPAEIKEMIARKYNMTLDLKDMKFSRYGVRIIVRSER